MGVRFKARSEYDWYQATIGAEIPDILSALISSFPAAKIEAGSGWKGYTETLRGFDDSGDQQWMLAHGGSNGSPNLSVTGDHANEWAAVCNETFPGHAVTRMDVAIDRVEPGLFDRLLPFFIERAQKAGTSIPSAGDWHSDVKSRTIYAGAPSSRLRVRMYEKGREILAKHGAVVPGLADQVSADWVRCEVQIRPSDKLTRQFISQVPIEDLWGVSTVSQTIIEQINGLAVPRLHLGSLKLPTTTERAYRYCLKQYGKTLNEVRQSVGDERFFEQFIADLKQLNY